MKFKRNTFMSLSDLGLSEQQIDQLDFRELLRSFEINSIQFLGETNSSHDMDLDNSFNFLCQPLIMDLGTCEVVDMNQRTDRDDIVFL